MKFVEFYEQRKKKSFDDNFDRLCLDILESNMNFYEYWGQFILPVLCENDCENPEQLLLELDFKKSYANPLNWFGGNKGVSWSGEKPQNSRWQAGMSNMNTQKQQADQAKQQAIQAQKQQKLNNYQGTVDTHLGKIKQKFAEAMRMFLKSISDDALKNNDKTEYSVAKAFYDRLMKTAQPLVDKMSFKASYGKNPYGDEFANRRQGVQNTMKDQLMSKHTNPNAQMLDMPGNSDLMPPPNSVFGKHGEDPSYYEKPSNYFHATPLSDEDPEDSLAALKKLELNH